MGRLVGIYVAPRKAAEPQEAQQVTAVVGKGLEGDRYCEGQGTFSKGDTSNEVTLIELEAIEALDRDYDIKLPPAETRRNLITESFSSAADRRRPFETLSVDAWMTELQFVAYEHNIGDIVSRESLCGSGGPVQLRNAHYRSI